MKRLSLTLVLALGVQAAAAHDMFLVLQDHDLPTESEVTVALYNGTFDESLNSIARDRMLDVSVVDGSGKVVHPGEKQWRDKDDMSLLTFETGGPGTYLIGVSTRARNIELSAEDFNEYLKHDGVLDVLAAREEAGILDQPAVERYSKHVKTIAHADEAAGRAWAKQLGYPIEIVPRSDPATLCPGDELEFEVLADGAPAAEQLVYASYAGFHEHTDDGGHQEAVKTRTDASGVGSVEISNDGRWYLRLIRMLEVDEDDVDYESNWATLTFEVECPEAGGSN
jgi:uncharacterized GH25 family protein